MEEMVVRGEMRGVVVGRSPVSHPGPTHAIRPRGTRSDAKRAADAKTVCRSGGSTHPDLQTNNTPTPTNPK